MPFLNYLKDCENCSLAPVMHLQYFSSLFEYYTIFDLDRAIQW